MQRPTKEQIRGLPLYEGLSFSHIHLVEDERDAERAINALSRASHIGFDTETKPIFRKGQTCPGPTLIQLATPSEAFLFPTRFPAAIKAAAYLLANEAVLKVGFGLSGERKALRDKLQISLNNSEDLSVTLKHLAKQKNPIGARASVAMILQQRLGKGAQKSNWGAYPLSKVQIQYAANDAHSAICVASVLQHIKCD